MKADQKTMITTSALTLVFMWIKNKGVQIPFLSKTLANLDGVTNS